MRFCFLVFIFSLLVKMKVDEEASPVMLAKDDDWLSYNSISFTLYSKFFIRSTALPKCTKFSKWKGISIASVLDETGLI